MRLRAMALFGFLAGVALLCGCATQSKTAAERKAAYRESAEGDLAQLGDDWDHFWLINRPSRLSHFNMR